MRKSGFKKDLPALPPGEFYHVYTIKSNHTVFLVQSGINPHLRAPQKAEIALAEAAHAISTF